VTLEAKDPICTRQVIPDGIGHGHGNAAIFYQIPLSFPEVMDLIDVINLRVTLVKVPVLLRVQISHYTAGKCEAQPHDVDGHVDLVFQEVTEGDF